MEVERARKAWADRDLHLARSIVEGLLGADGETLAKARFLAGVVYRECGEASLAVEMFDLLMAEWDRYTDVRVLMEGDAYYNLALCYRQARDLDRAVTCYWKAVAVFRSEKMDDSLARVLQNVAWALAMQGNIDEAVAALLQAEMYGEEGSPHYWHQRLGFAFVALHEKAYGDSLELCADIVGQADVPAEVRCHALWLSAKAQLALDHIPQARILTDLALSWALIAKDPRLMNDVNELRAQIQEAR